MELVTYSNIASTQDTARQIALDGHLLPFAIIAETQSAGRGRRGKSWDSPQGGLWLTLALAVPSPETVRQSAMVAAHAVASVVLTAIDVQHLCASILNMVELDISSLILRGFDTFSPWMDANLALRDELVTVEFNDQRESGWVTGLSRTGALLLKNPDGSLTEVDAGSVYDW
jgi:biotin-(acetyl-CoA carboxylase) ligase